MIDEDALIARYVEPDRWKGGADEVRLKPYGQHVWAIIGDYVAHEDAVATARAYEIPVDAVRAAVAYYRRHKAVLDNRLAANDPDFADHWYRELSAGGCMTGEDELIARYIEPDRWKGGADEVRLKPYGQHVWAIIGDYLAHEDPAQTAESYEIPLEPVEAALVYYRRHKEVIDNRLAANMA